MTDQPVNDEPANDESDDSVEPAAEIEADEDIADIEVAEASVPHAATSGSAAPTATAVLTHVVRSIVDDADAVHVDAVEGRNRLKLEVKVGPGDLGRVIGRRGRTAQSIRTVVRAAATRDGVEVDVDFVD